MIAIVLYATIVGTLDHFAFFKDISIPIGVSALIGTLLSLLLAFRTSQSYERWWEARIVWGAIVNDSRTLVRQVLQFIGPSSGKGAAAQRFAERQIMWAYALTSTLRQVPLPPFVQQYCDAQNISAGNLPNKLLTLHAADLATVAEAQHLNPNMQVQIDSTLLRLTDAMGKCERIKNTVFPRSYSMLIHFLIYVLMTILPFGLDDNHSIVEICLATLIPALFIAIERTAILMQDPFENKPTDTPMTAICDTIERNLREMVNLPEQPKPADNGEYYLM